MPENNAYEPPTTTGPEEKKRRRKPRTLTRQLIDIVVVLAILGFLIGMLLPAVGTPRTVSHSSTCLNNIRQIALAMLNYENANGHFPPAYIADENGKPMHSWRVLILPYLEQEALYKQYSLDEPWDGPNNSKLHDIVVPGFQCPAVGRGEQVTDTSYMVVTGKGTAFDGDHGTTFGEVSDGASYTVMILEVANSGTHWMEPVDISLEEALARFTDKSKVKDCCNHPRGCINVSLMDGSTHTITLPISAENLRAIATIDDGEAVDITDL